MAKSSVRKKSKGPKGRKARAKAKLQRQWGEEVVEEPRKRIGPSRLVSTDRNLPSTQPASSDRPQPTTVVSKRSHRQSTQENDGNDSEEESADSSSTTSQVYTTLLDTICRRQSEQHEHDDDDASNNSMVHPTNNHESDDESFNSESFSDILAHSDNYKHRFGSGNPLTANQLTEWTHNHRSMSTLSLKNPNLQLQVSPSSLFQQLTSSMANISSSHSVMATATSVSLYADALLFHSPHVQQILTTHVRNHVQQSSQSWQHASQQQQQEPQEQPQRDRGYARPTVLVLLPTRGCCHDFVHALLSKHSNKVEHLERFDTEYGPPPQENDDNTTTDPRRHVVLKQKGTDWNELFGDTVNSDDDFKLGLAFSSSNNKKVKLYTDFYRSDMIVGSPLAIKLAAESTSSEGAVGGADFLSSIEICIIVRADVVLMQNWDHVNDVLAMLNQQIQTSTDVDFSRVRNFVLDGQACHWRQLIMSTTFWDPMIVSSFKRHAKSQSGLVRMRRKVPIERASISQVVVPTRQVFQRVPVKSIMTQGDDRVQYFMDKVLVSILENSQKHTLVFIPSYFDFVSVRNQLLKKEVDFVAVTEYSRVSEVSRGRARFLQGRRSILLYTGRAHYFLRHSIKGVRHVVFLGLPECPEFYADHVNVLNEGLGDEGTATSVALFTKYDSHALERIVGSGNCNGMVDGDRTTFVFE